MSYHSQSNTQNRVMSEVVEMKARFRGSGTGIGDEDVLSLEVTNSPSHCLGQKDPILHATTKR